MPVRRTAYFDLCDPDYPARHSGRRQAADPLQMVVQDPVDHAQRVGSFLGGDPAKDEIDRIWQTQRVWPGR